MRNTLRVRLDILKSAYFELEQTTRNVRDQLYELERIERNLMGLSGMDAVLSGIRSEKGNLEEQFYGASNMLEALGAIIQQYTDTENRAVDYAEGNSYRYRIQNAVSLQIDFSNIRQVSIIG